MAILNPDQINAAFWGRKISYRDALSQMQALGRGVWDLGTNASELENYSREEQAAIKSGGFLPPISASPQTQATGGFTLAEILAKYRNGEYGAVGTRDAKFRAVEAMQQFWQGTGVAEAEAKSRALDTFNRDFGVAATTTPPKTTTTPPEATKTPPEAGTGARTDFKWPGIDLSTDAMRRGLPTEPLFGAALRRQAPGGGVGPWQSFLSGQEDDLTLLYKLGGLTGDVPDLTTFDRFIGDRGGIAPVNRGEFAAYGQRAANALSQPATDQSNPFREFFTATEDTSAGRQAAQQRQFGLAFAGAYPNLAREAIPYAARGAGRAFDKFRFDQPGLDFLPWFFGRGQNFF